MRLGPLDVIVVETGEASTASRKVTFRRGRARVAVTLRREAGESNAQLAARALEEVKLAASDADEYLAQAMGEATGAKALRLGRTAKRVIAGSRDIGVETIDDALDEARERGLI